MSFRSSLRLAVASELARRVNHPKPTRSGRTPAPEVQQRIKGLAKRLRAEGSNGGSPKKAERRA